MRSGVPRKLSCFCTGIALLSGCTTTTDDLRITYRGKETHKAFLICQDGSAAAAWGRSTVDDAIKGAYQAAASVGYGNCVLEDVDGRTGADFVFQRYLTQPKNKVFLECSGRVFAAWGEATLDSATRSVMGQAQSAGASDCATTNINGEAVEKAPGNNDTEQVFERPPEF